MKEDLTKQIRLTTLPTETLQYLVSYLTIRQRFTLLYVCRALSQPCFWRSFYTDIHLNEKSQYNKFIVTISESAKGNTIISNLGHFVKTLTLFSDLIVINKKTIGILQHLCPNMIYFDTSHPRRPKPATLLNALPWKHIERISSSLYSDAVLVAQHAHNQLTHISLDGFYAGDGDTIFGSSLSFPHLVDLTIKPEEFSIDMLTDIIKACPRLQHLTLDAVILPKLREGWNAWDTITPMLSINHLELQSVHTDELLWLKILAHAFPMLDTLTINHLNFFAAVPVMGDDTVVVNNSDDERDFMDDNFDMATLRKALLDMLDTLTHMVRGQLLHISYNNKNLNGYFLFQHWIATGKQLEDVQFDYSCKDDGTLEDLMFIQTEVRGDPHDDFSGYEYGSELAAMGEWQSKIVTDFIKSNNNSLRAFHFFVNHALFDSQLFILNTLADCTWLHTLVLRFTDDMCGYYDMETVNTILDTLPNLKSLEYPASLASEPDVDMSYWDAAGGYCKDTDDESHSEDMDDLCCPGRPPRPSRPAPHGLERLVYNGQIEMLRFVSYIYKRCPDLRELQVDARQTSDGSHLLADYSKWNLQQLDLGSSGGNKSKTMVLVLENGYTPTRERWYENTPKGWKLRSDIPPTGGIINTDWDAPYSPDLVLAFNTIEQIQLFTPSSHHHVF